MSAKKRQAAGPVDPLALGEVLVGVRNLLRYHKRIGIRAYPDKKRFATLLTGQRHVRSRTSGAKAHASDTGRKNDAVPVLREVQEAIRQCRSCQGNQTGPVLTAPDFSCPARLVVVGDWCRAKLSSGRFWSDRDEDEMLWRMMAAIGEQEDRVYTTNVLKCPPGGDRAASETVQRCIAHLHREIAAVGAPLVLAMGEFAVSVLLGGSRPLVRIRGRLHRQVCAGRQVRIMPTFHPHFLLRHAEMKQPAWQDLLLVKRYLSEKSRL